jgi:hypothetical protein
MLVDSLDASGPRIRSCLETNTLEIQLFVAMFSEGANHRLESAKLPNPPAHSERTDTTQGMKYCVVPEAWVAQ